MDKFFDKLSRYHLLTNLIPGVLFLCLLKILGIYSIDMTDWVMILFVGYFAGLMISRFGSIAIEPWFKKWKIVKYAPYPEFLEAEKKDVKIPELLADNNMYRTFVALFLVLIVLEICHIIPAADEFIHTQWAILTFLALLLLLYVLAYRKQTVYIRKRVKKSNNQPVE